jgi:hypothetical protein
MESDASGKSNNKIGDRNAYKDLSYNIINSLFEIDANKHVLSQSLNSQDSGDKNQIKDDTIKNIAYNYFRSI